MPQSMLLCIRALNVFRTSSTSSSGWWCSPSSRVVSNSENSPAYDSCFVRFVEVAMVTSTSSSAEALCVCNGTPVTRKSGFTWSPSAAITWRVADPPVCNIYPSGRMFLTNGLTSCSVFGMGAVCIVNIVCLFILKHTLSRCINAREPNDTNR